MIRRMNLLVLPFFLLLSAILMSNTFGGDSDIEFSIGSSATTKLVQSVLNRSLQYPQFVEIDLNSADDPWFQEVARLDSRNRIDIGSFEVRFKNQSIEVESHKLHMNSTTLISNAALPLFFIDQKSLLLNVEVKRAYLHMNIEESASLRVDECVLDHENIHMSLDRSYLLNLLLRAISGTLPERLIRDRVCGLLLNLAVNLHEKYTMELHLKSMIPEKFTRYMKNENVRLRSQIESLTAKEDEITITATMQLNTDSTGGKSGHSPLSGPVKLADFLITDEAQHSSDEKKSQAQLGQSKYGGKLEESILTRQNRMARDQQDAEQNEARERILLWAEDRLLNELLNEFRWDFQWINESIPLNSQRLPVETRAFFEVICPECIFMFNISADGQPNVEIGADKSMLIRNRNRIAAAVSNPTLGGQKRTAIDLSMELQLRLVPQIQDGIFRTHLELAERKVEVKNGSAFPSNMNRLVEQLIQDLIAEDIWPVLQRDLEPLIYQSGIQMPSYCGLDPKTARLHFKKGRFGVSAQLDLKKISFYECFQQFKNGLPDTSKLFKLPEKSRG